MSHSFDSEADALVMDQRDHVATALRELPAGETVRYRSRDGVERIEVLEPIPFGHKLAITKIESGTDVRKYGEVIGRSVTAIEPGQHVHVHNIEGIRGRGDKAHKAHAI
jgi:altronate dehydratase small subunit